MGEGAITNDVGRDGLSTPTEHPPAPPEDFGTLSVILATEARSQPAHSYRLSGPGGGVVASNLLQRGVLGFSVTNLPPGLYRLEVTEIGRGWTNVMGETVGIEAHRTNNLKFLFALNAELTVKSTPSGALVEWPPGVSRSSAVLSNRTPFIHKFASGRIPFTARLAGHFDLHTNYLFNPASGDVLHLQLTRSPYPLRGETWTNSIGMIFNWLPRLSNWVCATETTVGEFRQFVESTGFQIPNDLYSLTAPGVVQLGLSWRSPGFAQTDEHPVVGVSWQDAVEFCRWLTEQERERDALAPRQQYRLPTTNEWFALAGGRFFPWGNTAGDIRGNYAGLEVEGGRWPANWPALPRNDGHAYTAPVRERPPAGDTLGLDHLAGNVAEWCQEQVLCGGSWRHGDSNDVQKLATRELIRVRPQERHDFCGFRVVLSEE